MAKQTNLAQKSRKYNPPLKEVYSREKNPQEEKEARGAMEYFVTDPEGSIYAITPLVPEIFSALLKARYSRTELSAKQLLWREFVSKKSRIPWAKINSGRKLLNEVFNFEKAETVAERILLQYGDDSVFELGGGHIFFDRISMVATKFVEDARIGLSPLEKSTRYVVFDQKDGSGDYSFYKDPKIMDSQFKKLYLEVCRNCFDLYSKVLPPLTEHFRNQVPLEKQKFPDLSKNGDLTLYSDLQDEKSIKAANLAYNQSIKAKVCDIARVLLPAATFTNVGVFGNARAFGYLFTKLLGSEGAELQMIAEEGKREMAKILPKFFDVVDNDYGKAYQEYLRKTDEVLKKRAKSVLKGLKPEKVERVELVRLDPNPEINIAAALLYPYSNLPLKQIIKVVKKGGKKLVGEILKDSLKFRTNRRHKPPRAFEIAGYELTFDILGNFGVYRDLERQRMMTQQRQLFSSEHGFDMPEEFKILGMEKEFEELMVKVNKAYHQINKEFPFEAQYVSTMANYTRFYFGMNLRQAFWVSELRSTPQGHFSYRTIAQDMFLKACEVYPFLKDLKEKKGQFVDMSDRSANLERMEAMQRIQAKLARIEDKDE